MKPNKVFFIAVWFNIITPSGWAVGINQDGEQLVLQAARAFQEDTQARSTIQNKHTKTYVNNILKRLIPKKQKIAKKIKPRIVVLDSDTPELHAYVSGQIIISSGALYCVDNEAQLATLISHELANVIEGFNIEIYQQIKAKERAAARRSFLSGVLGEMAVIAADYALEVESAEQTDRLMEGEATYKETAKRMAKAGAAHDAVVTAADALKNIPSTNEKGQRVDPRLQFEVAADVQAMQYLAKAGYDVNEAAKAWRNFLNEKNRLLKQQETQMGAFAEQLRLTQQMMRHSMQQAQEAMGLTALIRTLGDAPPGRDDFVASLTKTKEVRAAQVGRTTSKGEKQFKTFVKKSLLSSAEKALEEERHQQALKHYETLYTKGIKEAPVLYGLAKSKLGDFAFAATTAQKQEAEKYYKEAAKIDRRYALPFRGLGELYEDWERYEDAIEAYKSYLKLSAKAKDRHNIERKLKTLKRKASR